jgi:transposase-like protein
MTKGQGKTDFIDVKALRSSDPDYLRAMVEAIVQATLEAEMTEALAAGLARRCATRELRAAQASARQANLLNLTHATLRRVAIG